MTLFKLINVLKTDLEANANNIKGKFIVINFRVAQYLSLNSNKLIYLSGIPIVIFYKFFFQYVMGVDLPLATQIGKGLTIHHGMALVINPHAIIGDNVVLRHCTTIGNKYEGSACPILGNNVDVGSNVVIIGGVTIGDNCIIGAGSVVTKSIPKNSIAYGNPLIIRKI